MVKRSGRKIYAWIYSEGYSKRIFSSDMPMIDTYILQRSATIF